MTDLRELCARMADELDYCQQLLMDDRRETHALSTEARAALAQPELQRPVPVTDRLPGLEDCDAEGQCWWWHPDHKEDEFSDGWMLLKPEWADGRHDADDSLIYTHWLPHHALPVPQAVGRWEIPLELRGARRPKPPSLKEQALEALRHAPGPDYPNPITLLTADEHALIRRALEQLPDNE